MAWLGLLACSGDPLFSFDAQHSVHPGSRTSDAFYGIRRVLRRTLHAWRTELLATSTTPTSATGSPKISTSKSKHQAHRPRLPQLHPPSAYVFCSTTAASTKITHRHGSGPAVPASLRRARKAAVGTRSKACRIRIPKYLSGKLSEIRPDRWFVLDRNDLRLE